MNIIPGIELPEGTIPQLGLGTWQLTGETCVNAVSTALELGYRHIDTAEMYGNEREISQAIEGSGIAREDLFITSKVRPANLGEGDISAALDGTLSRLGTDYVDLYLIHWPNPNIPIAETLGALAELRTAGKARNIGVSNFIIPRLREALEATGIPIATNQVEFHPLLYQRALFDFCSENGIVLTAYSPIARGEVFEEAALVEIADHHGKTAAQVSLRWLIQKGIVVIPKASSDEHLRENLEVFDFQLTDDEVERIDGIEEHHRFVNAGFPDFQDEQGT